MGVVDSHEEFDDIETDELLETVAIQTYYLQTHIDYTQELLTYAAQHFQTITQNMNEVQIYDHSVTVNQDLFQTYFNMSIGLAGELNYLGQKEDDLNQVLLEQMENGDVAARNRRRKSSQNQKPLEVHNKDTKRLVDSLTVFKNKIDKLESNIKEITATNQAVIKKLPIIEAYQNEQN